MTRLLILIGLAVGVLWWLFGRKRVDAEERQASPPAAPRAGHSTARRAAPAQIVACAHCGVHLPRDEATADAQGRLYCGEEHRVAGPR